MRLLSIMILFCFAMVVAADEVDSVEPSTLTFLGLRPGQSEAETLKELSTLKKGKIDSKNGRKTIYFQGNNRISEAKSTSVTFYQGKLLMVYIGLPRNPSLRKAIIPSLEKKYGKLEDFGGNDIKIVKNDGLRIMVSDSFDSIGILCIYTSLEQAIEEKQTRLKSKKYKDVF